MRLSGIESMNHFFSFDVSAGFKNEYIWKIINGRVVIIAKKNPISTARSSN